MLLKSYKIIISDEFENNVTEFTSNEIRFKFNTNSTATIDYELFATEINGITFTHKYSTTETGESVFVPNVYVYDYSDPTNLTLAATISGSTSTTNGGQVVLSSPAS